MKIVENGFIVWAIRLVGVSGILSVVYMLMAQSKVEGIQVEAIDTLKERNTAMEGRIEQRDAKFDTFLLQQTELNTTTKLQQETLMKFLEAQVEFNGEVQKHIIKEDNE